VREPPPAVPRWTVAPSRNTFRSPISTRLASPRNFRSCGTRPIEVKGKSRFPSPTRVSPSITTCDSRTVPRPSRTLSPTRQKGPTRTPGSRTAPAATRASGSTSGDGRVATCRRRRASAARDSPTRTSPWKRTRSPRRWTSARAQLISGHDRAAELRLVEAHHPDFDAPRVRGGLQEPDPRRLGQGLEDQHARHDRLGREVAGEEVLRPGHVLRRDQTTARIVLDDAVHEHERVLGRDLADQPSDLAGNHSGR
jgi:hypothetical protein